MMTETFEISHDREFLKHFLTRWRTLSLSQEMVEKLRDKSKDDPYAAYGYGRWLAMVNPDGKHIKKAEVLLTWSGTTGNVPDAKAALAEMCYDGRIEDDKAMPEAHAFLMQGAYKAGSELAQYLTLRNTIYGEYGYPKNPDMVADILRKHLEKNPGSDPIYYDLLGQAIEDSDPEAAEKAYRTCVERGEAEAYYSLALLYKNRGDEAQTQETVEEGVRHGAVNCRRFKANMDQEDFENLSAGQQAALHEDIAEGLDYAIARHDRYACYRKGVLQYYGWLGFSKDTVAALRTLERGCEMGHCESYWCKAAIQHDERDNLPAELRLSAEDLAKTCLQAVRLGDREMFTLEQVARAYVTGLLSRHDEEIEELWLEKYLEESVREEDDASKDSTGVVSVYPQGFFYGMDTEARELDLDMLAANFDARGFDVVHFSPLLTRITKALSLDKESCHVAMLVDKDGLAKDLPDNMPATIVYGRGYEIRGTVIFVLEDDNSYKLLPMLGLQRVYMFLQMLSAATGGLVRQASPEELEAIGAADAGRSEE